MPGQTGLELEAPATPGSLQGSLQLGESSVDIKDLRSPVSCALSPGLFPWGPHGCLAQEVINFS